MGAEIEAKSGFAIGSQLYPIRVLRRDGREILYFDRDPKPSLAGLSKSESGLRKDSPMNHNGAGRTREPNNALYEADEITVFAGRTCALPSTAGSFRARCLLSPHESSIDSVPRWHALRRSGPDGMSDSPAVPEIA